MPTMQNKTVNAAAVTWNDSRLHSAVGLAFAAREFADSPVSCMCGVRICAVTLSLSAFQILNAKIRLLTNYGMLKILGLEVEEHLHSMHSNSLNDAFTSGKRRNHERDPA